MRLHLSISSWLGGRVGRKCRLHKTTHTSSHTHTCTHMQAMSDVHTHTHAHTHTHVHTHPKLCKVRKFIFPESNTSGDSGACCVLMCVGCNLYIHDCMYLHAIVHWSMWLCVDGRGVCSECKPVWYDMHAP